MRRLGRVRTGLGRGAKNEKPVPDVVGMPVEEAWRALSYNGHAGEVSFIRRAEGVEPGTNKGASMLVYITVSGRSARGS
jgi:hypothetical protein